MTLRHACGVLLARRDEEAARVEQVRERGYSRNQDVAVRHGLHPSLRGALMLVATVAAGVMAMATTPAAATREVALLRRGNVCMAKNAGAGTTVEQFAHMWANCGVNESVGLTGPIKTSGGRGARSAVANAPVSLCLLTLSGLLAWL